MFTNINGVWRNITDIFVNIAGTWRKATDGFVNIAGTWRRFWSGGNLAPQNPVTISQSTNASTYLVTLTGTNYSWTPGPPSLTYYFEWSNNGGSSWTTMQSGNAINPAYGSSTSYTYTIDSVGPPLYFSANAVNTYRFRVAATYGSQSASSSATTTIQGPTNVTLTAGTVTQNSVALSWTASTGANRYMVYYAVSGNALSLYAGTSNLSIIVSGLNPSTAYEFRVLPITGSANNTGYYGNYSNIATATTGADLTNTAVPTISGTIQEGQTISMSNGSWNLTPDSYNYQWLYYDQAGVGYEGYLPISGATSSSYLIPLNYRDIYGQFIRARVTANKSGYTSKNAYSTGQTVAYDATIPGAPSGLTATDVGTNRPYNNAAVSLSWTAPTNNGGSAITGYKIMYAYSLDSYATWYTYTNNTGSTSTSLTATGFAAPFVLKFRVYAINSIGTGTSYSESAAVTTTTVPQAPTIGTATTFNGYATVTYTANANGGKAINTYTATSSPGGITGSASSGSIFVYSLGHNTIYTFTVTATNANGTSTASSASNSIYGVNIGSVTNITSTSTSSSISLFFTQASNSTSTRAFLNGTLDGSTSGTSYTFSGLSSGTSYSLGLAGVATVGGTVYVGPTTTSSYSTSVAQYTVTWNANGGTVSPSSTTANAGSSLTTPTPSRSGYTFNGWYNTPSGDFLYGPIGGGVSWTPPSTITMYARWTIISGTPPATPTGVSVSGSGLVTWTASSGATSYTIDYFLASNGTGSNAFNPTPGTSTTTSYQITYANNPTTGVYCNYARARVRANNASGSSAYSAWYPTSTTYV
jgi:uncharacterized repeat protein (TIGR02543 family)